jgi:hypothetical protein
MKETYFTDLSLDQQARELYQQVSEIAHIKTLEFKPSQSALLVLDMQAYFGSCLACIYTQCGGNSGWHPSAD